MDDCCQLPDVPPRGPIAVRQRLEELRRFHFGDPAARREEIPDGILPAALHALRGAPAGGDWPLIVDPAAGEAPFARSLGAWLGTDPRVAESGRALGERLGQLAQRSATGTDDLGRIFARQAILDGAASVAEDLSLAGAERDGVLDAAAEISQLLSAEAVLVGFGVHAAGTLLGFAATRRHAAARAQVATAAAALVRSIDEILDSDRARRPGTTGSSSWPGQFGPLGARLMDPARLSEVVAHRRSGRALSDERCRQLEETNALLATISTLAATPIWVPANAADPVGDAVRAFDQAAAACTPIVRALRHARLESARAFEPERHGPWLDRLDWRQFEPIELALVPAIFVELTVEKLLDGDLPALTRLLLSGRPVQIVIERTAATPQSEAAGFEPGLLGVVVGGALVHQGASAEGVALASGFERGLAAARPALHLIEPIGAPPQDLDPWWVAWARLAGRATPGFLHDPARGTSWASRFDLALNPSLLADWPETARAVTASSAGTEERAPFTFVDAALLDPAWRHHFAVAPESTELVEFADWLTLPEAQAVRTLPFAWGVAPGGAPARLVVSRELARVALERRAFWRALGELAGVRSEPIDAAIAATLGEATTRAAADQTERARRHADELERLRRAGQEEAAHRLVAALMGLEERTPGSPAGEPDSVSMSDPEGGGIP